MSKLTQADHDIRVKRGMIEEEPEAPEVEEPVAEEPAADDDGEE